LAGLRHFGPPHFGGFGRGSQEPVLGFGTVSSGQHLPQVLIWVGAQQLPSKAIPCFGSEQGVTHGPSPPKRVCPAGQAGGGHMPPGAMLPNCAGLFVLSQRQDEILFGITAPGCVPSGQSQAKTQRRSPESGLGTSSHSAFIGAGQKQ
jgi:hypothetical protein